MTNGTKLAIAILVVVLSSAAYLYSQVQREIAYQDCMAAAAVAASNGTLVTTSGDAAAAACSGK